MALPKTFISRAFKKSGPPIHLIWFVTAKCNLRCVHCFYHEEVASPLNKELPHDEMMKIIGELPPLLSLVMTGGEPLVRADIHELIQNINDRKICETIRIFTNGHATDRIVSSFEKILSNCKNTRFFASVSLDGFEKDHDLFRKYDGTYQKTIATIKELNKLKKRFPTFQISINTTLHRDNQDSMDRFRNYIQKEVGIYPGITIIRGDPMSEDLKQVKLDIYKQTIDAIKGDRLKSEERGIFQTILDTRESLGHEMALETFSSQNRTYACHAGDLLGVIYANGDVYPCELLPNGCYGNIRDFDFDLKKVWQSEKSQDVRKFIADKKCSCTWECQFTTNTLYNKSNWPRFAKDLAKNLLKLN